jgi:hypothetical protein
MFFGGAYLSIEGTLNGNQPSWSIDPEPAQPLKGVISLWFYAMNRANSG